MSATTDAARENARQSTGEFGEQGLAEPAGLALSGSTHPQFLVECFGSANAALKAFEGQVVNLSAPDLAELERRAALRGAPLTVTVQPQVFIDGHTVESGAPYEIDVAALAVDLDEDEREAMLDGDPSIFSEIVQRAQEAGAAPDRRGPFDAWADFEDLQDWFPENPAWKPDGVTPHPVGGYVVVEDTTVNGRKVREYRNANGRLHRTDGPASVTTDDGAQPWKGKVEQHLVDGDFHCETGPAWIRVDPEAGTVGKRWFVHGEKVAETTESVSRGWSIDADGRPVQAPPVGRA